MNIKYYAVDGTIKSLGDDELQHWKYIKKIKEGSGWRYFYTPEELKAYYEGSKAVYKVGNSFLDYRDDVRLARNISKLEREKNAKQEKQAFKAYQEVGARGGSEEEAMKKAMKDVAKTEVRYQIDKKKLEAENKIGKKKRAAKSEAKAIAGTAELAAKGAKDSVDSIPRLQKHGSKYYIADKKIQDKIEKSGAGGNYIDYSKKTKSGGYGASDKFKNKIQSDNYKERARANKIESRSRTGIGKVMKEAERASNLAKAEAAKSASKGQTKKYEKYEAKNVINKKLSDVRKKNKTKAHAYIEKIKSGSGWRYIYDRKELKNMR